MDEFRKYLEDSRLGWIRVGYLRNQQRFVRRQELEESAFDFGFGSGSAELHSRLRGDILTPLTPDPT